MSEEDLDRRQVITALMTGAPLPLGFADTYAETLAKMDALEADGLVRRGGPEGLQVTPLGRFFIRNVAMHFDRYLSERPGKYSQTV